MDFASREQDCHFEAAACCFLTVLESGEMKLMAT